MKEIIRAGFIFLSSGLSSCATPPTIEATAPISSQIPESEISPKPNTSLSILQKRLDNCQNKGGEIYVSVGSRPQDTQIFCVEFLPKKAKN